MPPLNAFTACKACRRLKRKCSRGLPACNLCVRSGRSCEYGADVGGAGADSLQNHSRSWSPLESFAEPWLYHNSDFPRSYFVDFDKFRPLSRDLLVTFRPQLPCEQRRDLLAADETGGIIALYESTIHTWLPMLSIKRLRQEARTLGDEDNDQWHVVFLTFLAIKAFAAPGRDSHRTSPIGINAAYVMAKRLSFTAECQGAVSIRVVQALALLALFELVHGLHPAAYLTVGRAVRLGTMIGIQSLSNAQQLFVDAGTWTLCEEQRRTWWAILLLDRVVAAGSPGLLMAAPSPGSEDLLPCNDADWTAGEIGSNEALLTRSFHLPLSLGAFARSCQAVHVLGKVVCHVHARKQASDVTSIAEEALQLHELLMSFDESLRGDASSTQQNHQVLALCTVARFLLYNQYACNEPPGRTATPGRVAAETELQRLSLAGIRELASVTVPQMATEIILAHQARIPSTSFSPLVAGCLYHAATECAWFVKEDDDLAMAAGFDAILMALRVLTLRWGVCVEYLGLLEATEYTT